MKGASEVLAKLTADAAQAEEVLHTLQERLAASTEHVTQESIARLAESVSRFEHDFQGRLAPRMKRASEVLAKLTAGAAQAEEVLHTLQQRLAASTEHVTQESIARLAESVSRFEHDFQGRLAPRMKRASEVLAKLTAGAAQAEEVLHTLQQRLAASTEHVTQESIARLAESVSRFEHDFQGRLAPRMKRASEVLAKLTAGAAQAEEVLHTLQERLAASTEHVTQESIARLAESVSRFEHDFQERLAPRMKGASEVLAKLTAGAAQAEEVLHTLQQRLAASTEHVTQESIARLAESVSRFEHDFQEMGRAATQKWLAELEAKATETTHSTFEALYKSSEWYEKKVQTQMQAALEKGLDQASNQLREKAGEISGLFASELDHYSRSFVEHTQGQMDEAVKDAVQRARGLFAQAAETSASTLADEAHRVAQR